MADMTYEELEEKMLDILEEVCGDDEVRTNRDEDLFALGLLDSMGAIELWWISRTSSECTLPPRRWSATR